MNKELGLGFEPSNFKFREMMCGLQSLLKKKDKMWFFLDASAECEKKFSSSFTGPSNKLTGWMISIEEIELFIEAYKRKNMEGYENQRISIWSYWDGEYSGGWLYSFEGPVFGEIDIKD